MSETNKKSNSYLKFFVNFRTKFNSHPEWSCDTFASALDRY